MVKSKTQILTLLFLSLLSLLSLTATAKTTNDVVKNLDVKKYMGRWYEIASFPSSFVPKNSANTRATYKLKRDGTIDVLNESWVNGKRVFAKAFAYKANASSDEAKLKVKFSVSPVAGDYWVLYVDRDYRYALVGTPSKMNLFILCRKTHMDDLTYKKLLKKAEYHGYDVSKLHKTPQSNPPPPDAEQGPKDTKGSVRWF